jgi:rhodanese-related sulfurtransferase
MKNALAFLLTLLLLTTATLAQTVEKDSIQVLSIAKFEKLSAKRKANILDVRTPEEVAEGHLIGSKTVNFLGANFTTEVQELNKNKTYLLYCRSGARTRKAADAMQKMGFKHVYMLDGGITAWKEAGKPVEK